MDMQKSNTPEDLNVFRYLSSDSGPSMERFRKEYIDSDQLLETKEKGILLNLTINTEKLIWLLNRLQSLTPTCSLGLQSDCSESIQGNI
jgi:hypothetical protein